MHVALYATCSSVFFVPFCPLLQLPMWLQQFKKKTLTAIHIPVAKRTGYKLKGQKPKKNQDIKQKKKKTYSTDREAKFKVTAD